MRLSLGIVKIEKEKRTREGGGASETRERGINRRRMINTENER